MRGFTFASGMMVVAILAGWLTLSGCRSKEESSTGAKSDSAVPEVNSNGIVGRGDNREAIQAVIDELSRHWTKAPDGWISQYPSQVYLATGKRSGPGSFYREVRTLHFGLQPEDPSDSDKLNGIQFRALCQFDSTPKRIYGDPNAFGPPKWSAWEESLESVRVEKRSGKWICSSIGYLIEGEKPDDAVSGTLK